MAKVRQWVSATVLPDGTVFTSGGSTKNLLHDVANQDAGVIHYDTEIFHPTTLTWTHGASLAVPRLYHSLTLLLPDATDIVRLSLVKTGAVTHSYDMEQRFIELPFTRSGNRLTASLPANGYQTPPGFYMVFALNAQGVPSRAKMIRINPI